MRAYRREVTIFEDPGTGGVAGGFEERRESPCGWREGEGGLGAPAPSRKVLC